MPMTRVTFTAHFPDAEDEKYALGYKPMEFLTLTLFDDDLYNVEVVGYTSNWEGSDLSGFAAFLKERRERGLDITDLDSLVEVWTP